MNTKVRYDDVVCESKKYGEKNDCAVKAVSIAAELPYHKAHAICKKWGRKDRRGMIRYSLLGALRESGLELEDISEHIPSFRTVKSFEKHHGNVKGTFVIFIRGHVLVWKDGQTEDWTAGSQKRIQKIFYVMNK